MEKVHSFSTKDQNIFFTSDTHFCHDRGFVYEPRGFKNIDEMNAAIVERWNSVVKPEDTVYHLGDAMLNDNTLGSELIEKLNGHIIMIRGNHDTNNRLLIYEGLKNVDDCGKWADLVKCGKYTFYLSHFPTNTSNLEKDAHLSQHIINLYGHTHQKTNFYNDIPYMYHVGVDSHNCYPVSVDQIIEDIKEKIAECQSML